MNNKTIRIVTIIILAIAVIVAAWWLWTKDDDQSNSSQPAPESAAVESALRQAREFEPNQPCTTVMTPARHVESGATYTFPSGCLPDGWEPARSGADQGSRQDGDTPVSSDEVNDDQQPLDVADSQPSSTGAQAEAVREAENFKPRIGQTCATVITPARHVESGAEHDFATSCLPDGWRALPRN